MKRILSLWLPVFLLLGCFDGKIALWTERSKEPAVVYPYAVASLPPADQLALKEGIPVRNETELAQLLEDYLS